MDAEIAFVKMHGAGNDFIMIDDRAGRFDLTREEIAGLCARRRGIGADGLILLGASAAADFSMRYFNSDGGEARLCGNGARCVAAFAVAEGAAGPTMRFETASGILDAAVSGETVSVGIGAVEGLRLGVSLASGERVGHFGICGVPHAVLVDEELFGLPEAAYAAVARSLRSDPAFGAEGANVNVVSLCGAKRFRYRTYERGVEAETLACGTGAVVTSVVLERLGLLAIPASCETSGGDVLEVSFTPTAGGAERCRLAGPAVATFRGTVRIERSRPV